MPGTINDSLNSLKLKLGISEPLERFVLVEQVVPVVPLDSFGFFTSLFSMISEASVAALTVEHEITCPTNKVRRVLACSMDAGAAWNANAEIRIRDGTFAAGFGPALAIDRTGTQLLLVDRQFLWYPGTTLIFRAVFGVANNINAKIGFLEEEVGIAPTG